VTEECLCKLWDVHDYVNRVRGWAEAEQWPLVEEYLNDMETKINELTKQECITEQDQKHILKEINHARKVAKTLKQTWALKDALTHVEGTIWRSVCLPRER